MTPAFRGFSAVEIEKRWASTAKIAVRGRKWSRNFAVWSEVVNQIAQD